MGLMCVAVAALHPGTFRDRSVNTSAALFAIHGRMEGLLLFAYGCVYHCPILSVPAGFHSSMSREALHIGVNEENSCRKSNRVRWFANPYACQLLAS